MERKLLENEIKLKLLCQMKPIKDSHKRITFLLNQCATAEAKNQFSSISIVSSVKNFLLNLFRMVFNNFIKDKRRSHRRNRYIRRRNSPLIDPEMVRALELCTIFYFRKSN